MYANGTCPSVTAADGTVTRGACPDAYGMVLGKSTTDIRSDRSTHSRANASRNVVNMFIPRNGVIIYPTAHSPAHISADGYW